MTNLLANLSPRHIVIMALQTLFGQTVWERLPERDSYLTNQEYAFVVSEVVDSPLLTNCEVDQRRSTIDITIYERSDCGQPGTLLALELAIEEKLLSIVQVYKHLIISKIIRQSSRDLPYIDDKFRARAVTFSLDYGVF